jgi:hypothetical protein
MQPSLLPVGRPFDTVSVSAKALDMLGTLLHDLLLLATYPMLGLCLLPVVACRWQCAVWLGPGAWLQQS